MAEPTFKLTFLGSADAFSAAGCRNSSYLVESGGKRLLVDCGPTTPWSVRKLGIEANEVGAVFITHFHGDHFLGLPMLILHHQVLHPTGRGLDVYGPVGIEKRIMDTYLLAYTQSAEKLPELDLVRFHELRPGERDEVRGTELVVDPVPMEHREESLGYRFERAGKALAFTGDTAWTPNLRTLAKGAEVLVTDCTYFDEDFGGHLSYHVIRERAPELEAKRIVLSHLGPRVRQNLDQLEHDHATDDLVMEI